MRRDGWRAGAALALFAALAAGMIALVRLTAAASDGGDLCRDLLDARRILGGQDPYAPFTGCGALHHSPHPPLNLLLVVPLAGLAASQAAALWDGLMLGALCLALALLWRELASHAAAPWLFGGLLLLVVWPPVLDTWLEAQIGPLILLLLVLAWRARRRGRGFEAGAWLAVATLLRLYPVLLFAYPLLRREWRVAAGGLATGAALTALTFPVLGPGEYLAYALREAPASSAEWVNDAHNVALRGWLGDWFVGNNTIAPVWLAPGVVAPLAALGTLAMLTVLLWRGWQARTAPPGSGADDLAWLLAVPAALVISPLAWPHYFDVLILPGAVLLAMLARRAAPWSAGWLLLAGLALPFADTLGLQLLFPLPRLLAWPAGIFVFALPFYALLCWCGGLWMAGRAALCVTPADQPPPIQLLTEGGPA